MELLNVSIRLCIYIYHLHVVLVICHDNETFQDGRKDLYKYKYFYKDYIFSCYE